MSVSQLLADVGEVVVDVDADVRVLVLVDVDTVDGVVDAGVVLIVLGPASSSSQRPQSTGHCS